MGLNDFSHDGQETSDKDISDSVAYIYIRGADNPQAYHLMSDKHHGSALVRNKLKSQPDYDDQHDFFQQFIVTLEDLFEDGNWEPMLTELEVTAEGITQYLDSNDELRSEVISNLKAQQEEAKAASGDD